jgi:hypothetical protein
MRRAKAKGPALVRQVASGRVRHVWLDRKVHISALGAKRQTGTEVLDRNLSQVGAPAAWAAGATGKGVTVAVLDTGADPNNPDLKGKILEQQNFIPGADDLDHNGHGTGVAGIIAGTGAAANGERRGVAFDAKLIVGKVADDSGGDEASNVIAGMEWAASKAQIVNMSLGNESDDPANDPLSKAADDLTAKYNTLFVVAAGNNGGTNTILAPGAASSALTVGAVDGQDRLAAFSSRGGDLMKPDIAAPGVDVIAPRAAGATIGGNAVVVDADYLSASGTSFASPHVAGAAADLLQAHPDWTPARLKAALMSTSAAVPGTVYQVGAGRLDVGAAATASIVADTGSVAFGSVPQGATSPVVQKVGWTNTGSTAVTLRLAATISDPAGQDHSGAVKLPATVTVPAGASAAVDLTLDPALLTGAGHYSGTVTAQAQGVSLRTAIGVSVQPAMRTVTLKATGLPDTPDGAFDAFVSLVDIDDRALFDDFVSMGADGTATVRVPSGHYAMYATVSDLTPGNSRTALVADPELSIDGDVTVPIDASGAQPVRMSAPGTHIDPDSGVGIDLERGVGGELDSEQVTTFDGATLYSTPVHGVRTGTLDAYLLGRLTDGRTTVFDVLHRLGTQVPGPIDYTVDPNQYARIDERFSALDGNTQEPLLHIRDGVSPGGFLASERVGDVTPGSTRTDFVSAEPGVQWREETGLPITGHDPVFSQLAAQRFAPNSTQIQEWGRQPFRPGPYSNTAPALIDLGPGASIRRRSQIHIEPFDMQDIPDGFDTLDQDPLVSRTMKLFSGNTLIGSSDSRIGNFSVPPTTATFRVHYDVDMSAFMPVSTKTSTDWTFTSSPDVAQLPLLTVGYRLPLDLLNHPNGDTATFTVSRVAGAAKANPTGLRLWTSLDDGATWQQATVTAAPNGAFSAPLPHAGKGQYVSLRVHATDDGGSAIDQTIIRAYSGA